MKTKYVAFQVTDLFGVVRREFINENEYDEAINSEGFFLTMQEAMLHCLACLSDRVAELELQLEKK